MAVIGLITWFAALFILLLAFRGLLFVNSKDLA
jgi:hypothetical protein